MTSTHTLAALNLPVAVVTLIRDRLQEAGYTHAISDGPDGLSVDMSGICLEPDAAQAWAGDRQPIATAPRDGRVIYLCFGEDVVSPGWWSPDNSDYPWCFIDSNGNHAIVNQAVATACGPTHWMPYDDSALIPLLLAEPHAAPGQEPVGTVIGGVFHYLQPDHGLADGASLFAAPAAPVTMNMAMLRQLVEKWRGEAEFYGDRYRRQVGNEVDHEDSGREWALERAVEELDALLDSFPVVELPDNADLQEILGRPNFTCGAIADVLRMRGDAIPRKAELEQAAVIRFLLNVYLNDPNNWSKLVGEELHRITIYNKRA